MFQRGQQGIAVMLIVLLSWVFLKKLLPDYWHCTALAQLYLRQYLNAALTQVCEIWVCFCPDSSWPSNDLISNVNPHWIICISTLGSDYTRCLWAMLLSFSWAWGWEFSIYFEYKVRSWTFQNWSWERRVAVTQVTKLGNVAREELKEFFCSKHIYVTPAATKQDCLMGMRGSGQPSFSR